ncbi:MAG: DTW domain-containing protein [Proteobacteria bacterium]|nr:DTW domain-containing protein [Pseudomonadota bacterium]MCP4916782.1 DTW domain-containing protein [Pseudomonadota bacterium]
MQTPRLCLCGDVRMARNACEVLVVRHFREKNLGSNSGRLVGLCLENSRIVDWGTREWPELDLSGDTWVLAHEGGTVPAEMPSRIVVMDGTWRQAHKMLRRVPGVADLPRLTLPAVPRERMRKQHLENGMATAEAIAAALDAIGDVGGDELSEAYELQVARMRVARGRGPA